MPLLLWHTAAARLLLLFLRFDFLQEFCRNTTHHCKGGHILCHNSACRNNRPFADGHTLGYHHIGANPDMIADVDGFVMIMPVIRILIMVNCGQHHIMPDQDIVSDEDTALILKMAAGVDKDTLADVDISTEVRIKGGNIIKDGSICSPVISDMISRISSGVWY